MDREMQIPVSPEDESLIFVSGYDLFSDSNPQQTVISSTPAGITDGNADHGNIGANLSNNIIYKIMAIFTDADPHYIRRLYQQYAMEAISENGIIDAIIEKMLQASDEYPKRPTRKPSSEEEIDIESQIAFVRELLPDADPNFLSMKVNELNPDELKEFVAEALENKNYPTLKDYNRQQQLSAQMRQYTTEFSVENFVKLVPDPVSTFENPNRNIELNADDFFYINHVFKNIFDRIPIRTIQKVLQENYHRPYACVKYFRSLRSCNIMKTHRQKTKLQSVACKNIPLLQELAFIEHEKEILEYISRLKIDKEQERIRAKENELLLTCNCCYDDEVMPKDSHSCDNNCIFCKNCITKSTEVAFSEGKLEFPCLGDCGSNFSLQTLQNALPPNLFSKVAQKKAVAEVKAAGIEDLEFCPFCDFATIPPKTDRIFRCQNPECLKESCRLCKEPSHVPLRCDEVEKDDDVRKRVYIENKMTEALLRKCWKCGISFYKEEGCNKMTCTCGAHTCYICGAKVENYSHFNGLGGDKFELCPLYSDTIAINQQNVLKGAQKAKNEIGVESNSNLKFDPTADVARHFEDRARKIPKEPHIMHMERLNQLAAARVPQPMIHHNNIQHRVQEVAAGLREMAEGLGVLNRMFPVERGPIVMPGPANQPPNFVPIERGPIGMPGPSNQPRHLVIADPMARPTPQENQHIHSERCCSHRFNQTHIPLPSRDGLHLPELLYRMRQARSETNRNVSQCRCRTNQHFH